MRTSLSAALLAVILVAGLTPVATATDPLAPAQPVAQSDGSGSSPDPSVDPSVAPSDPGASPVATPAPSPDPSPAPTDPTPAPSPDPTPEPSGPAPSPSASPPATLPDPSTTPVPDVPVIDGAAPPAGIEPAPEDDQVDPSAAALPRRVIVTVRDADVSGLADQLGHRLGFRAERIFSRTTRGFSATVSPSALRGLLADPAVVDVVPDDVVEATAYIPDGIRRIFGPSSPAARIDNVDDVRIDADVAVLDTGIAANPDLIIAGGYNCTSSDRAAWADDNGHGTHVSGTIGARDGTDGVVGVAPGVRLWAVKVLGSDGSGYRSWIICGLEWVAAQRDPTDSSRPLFEAVNMSLAGDGADDRACGTRNADLEHQAICKITGAGTVVVAAAGNDRKDAQTRVPAAYDEVITVSALADLDGKPGGLGGPRCWSWGGYDVDDTFADFSNYGADVDIMAPGKCVWSTLRTGGFGYMSGTSMAAPHVTGAAALYRASRPDTTPGEVREALRYLGNMGWATGSDPDASHEPLLDVSRLGPLGTFSMAAPSIVVGEAGGTRTVAVKLARSATFFEPVAMTMSVPSQLTATLDRTRLLGWDATTANLTVTIPRLKAGTYPLRITGTYHGVVASVVVPVVVENDPPVAAPPTASFVTGSRLSTTTVPFRIRWAPAKDVSSAIARYELRERVDSGSWRTIGTYAAPVGTTRWLRPGHRYAWSIRAQDAVGNWSPWVDGLVTAPQHWSDASRSITYRGTWYRYASTAAFGGTARYTRGRGADATLRFTGRAIAVIGVKGPGRGRAELRIDGIARATIDTYASTTRTRTVLAVYTFPTAGTHTVTWRDLATSGRTRIDLDALIVVP